MKSLKFKLFSLSLLLVINASAQVGTFIKDIQTTNIHNFNGYCVTTTQEYEVRFGKTEPAGSPKTEVTGVWYNSYGFRDKELSKEGKIYEMEHSYDNKGRIISQDIYLNQKLYERRIFSYQKDGKIAIVTYDNKGQEEKVDIWSATTHTIKKGEMSVAGGKVSKTIETLNSKGFPISSTFASNSNLLGRQLASVSGSRTISYNEHNDILKENINMDNNATKLMAITSVFAGKKFPKVIEYRDYKYNKAGNWISRFVYYDGVCVEKQDRQFLTDQEYKVYERTIISQTIKSEDKVSGHMILDIDESKLESGLNTISVIDCKQKDIHIESKVWVMRDGDLSLDKNDTLKLSEIDKTILKSIMNAISKYTKISPAYELSQNGIDKINVLESFDLKIYGDISGEKSSTGYIIKLIKTPENTWKIENKAELQNKGFTELQIEKLISSYKIPENKKNKVKLSIDRTPLEFRVEIHWTSNMGKKESAYFHDLHIGSYTLSKYNAFGNVLNTISSALDTLSE